MYRYYLASDSLGCIHYIDYGKISNHTIHNPGNGGKDKLIWKYTTSWVFSAKSFEKLLENDNGQTSASMDPVFLWKKLWTVKDIAPKVLVFIWRLVYNGLGCRAAIGRFARHVDVNCCYCIDEEESINHLFALCPRTRAILFASDLNFRFDSNSAPSIQNLIAGWLMAKDNYASFCYGDNVLRSIWKARNKLIFDNKPSSIHKILHDAWLLFTDYHKPDDGRNYNMRAIKSLVHNGYLQIQE
ncbi:uncharacterized protein LOC113315315 [Papaver somniferum]|uniref:uncharacterized protein LOC113315315 n=1 Tax=Papaver somniferum TaxID=3469 RepID=UPI000E6FA29C|nr:uncharacterized protein LOC113315315 [Papaver somniferum]